MIAELEHVCCARIPANALAVLADLRRSPGIRVTLAGESEIAWVRWEAGDEAVLRRLLPVSGVALYARRDAHWYRPGAHLPSFDVPEESEDTAIPLARAVTPEPIRATGPVGDAPMPVRLGLVREGSAQETTALRCDLADLGRWAEMAPAAELAAIEAARSGAVVWLRGRRLPRIAGDRFWGDRLLSPIGWRPEPGLPEPALRRALGAAEDEVVVLEAEGFETVPRAAFRRLSRAGVRLALDLPLGDPPS